MPPAKRKSEQDLIAPDTKNDEGKYKRPRKNGTLVEETAASSRSSRSSSLKKINGALSTETRVEKPAAKAGRKSSSTAKGATASKGNSGKAAGKEEASAKAANAATGGTTGVKSMDPSKNFWLMKAEPESRFEKGVDVKFSIDDLREAKEPEPWDGVRNPSARNNMRAMKKGDLAFFYHSNCKTPGIAGIMEIVQEHSVDESAFDPAHPYYDPKSDRQNPKWVVVHVEFRRKFKDLISLATLKSCTELRNMQMLKQSRLSVSAVTPYEAGFVMGLAGEGEDEKP